MSMLTPDDCLDFWFETGRGRWFAQDRAFDARIRRRFGNLVRDLERMDDVLAHPWMISGEGALALILALDQFPRNIYRGTAKAFELDYKALDVAHTALAQGADWPFVDEARAFFYMPFMHDETLSSQDYCVSLCVERLGIDHQTTQHARAHRDVIVRFGRFPHRNGVLGRVSTPEELKFLAEGGYAPDRSETAKIA